MRIPRLFMPLVRRGRGKSPLPAPESSGAIALGLCALIELTQLTGISAAVVDLWRPARYVLGTTFQATDLVAYAAGVVVAAGVDRAWSSGRRVAQ
jgi:hypothetical protein